MNLPSKDPNTMSLLVCSALAGLVLLLTERVSWVFSVLAGPVPLVTVALVAMKVDAPPIVLYPLVFALMALYFYLCLRAWSKYYPANTRGLALVFLGMIATGTISYLTVDQYMHF